MLSIRCFKCGWAWSMTPAEVAAALNMMHADNLTKHYMAECPKCRRVNKIPIKQLRRNAPPDWKPTPLEKQAAPGGQKSASAKSKTAAKATRTTGKGKARTAAKSDSKAKSPAKGSKGKAKSPAGDKSKPKKTSKSKTSK